MFRRGNGAAFQGVAGPDRLLEIEIGFGCGDFARPRFNATDRLFIGYETKTKATRSCWRAWSGWRWRARGETREGDGSGSPSPSPLTLPLA
ncbi:MAG: hypothetical protein H6643_04250 [Caldilineaceae bacterium]|nr:hypothetical protein [Caldilineaceae bacterium]